MIKKAERELDLRETLVFLWQHAAVILVCAVFGTGLTMATAAFQNRQAPSYSASALLTLDVGEEGFESRFQFYSNIANMSSVVIKSDELLSAVIENLELPLEPSELKTKVDIQSVNSSSFMRLTVTDADPERAQQICEQILAVAPDISEKMAGIGSLRAASPVEVTPSQTAGLSPKTGAVGGLLGIILSVLVLIGIELFDRTLQDAGDVEYYLGIKTLGVIPEGSSLEKKEEAYRLLRTHLQDLAPKTSGTIFLVAPTGRKTDAADVAEKLAKSFAETGKKVLLVDGVFHGGKLSERMGMNKHPGLAELLQNSASVRETVHTQENSSLAVLPCGLAEKIPVELFMDEKVQSVFTELRETYDCILLVVPDAVAAHEAARLGSVSDGILLVAAARKTEVETAVLAKETLSFGKTPVWGAVLTEYDWKKAKRRDGYYYAYASARRA